MKMRSIMLASTALIALASPASAKFAAFDNTLTGLIPDIFVALDVVSRELVGFIPAVMRDARVERAAKGQNVTWEVAPPANVVDITPAMTIPEPTDQTIGTGQLQITKSRAAQFGWVGEQQRGLNTGIGYLTVQQDQIAQALRSLTNEIETDIAVAISAAASRATGTPGTTPFASNVGDSAQVRKILDDNGAPGSGRSLIINTTTGAALRTLSQLTKANEAGTTMTLRDGELLNLNGLSIKESAQLGRHTKGTGASATTDNTGYAIGATVLTLASTGTGTLVAGDVITLAGDTNQYLVTAGDADVSNGGTFHIAAPGLRVAIPTSATAITVLNNYSMAGVGFSQNAFILAARLPALPQEGDDASDRTTITDPRSGLSFEFAIYKGYRKVRYEIGLAWGVKAIKTEHIAALLG